jgi:Na+-translocating ferredoxin:NAD+ oxidoreductase RnfG subunit
MYKAYNMNSKLFYLTIPALTIPALVIPATAQAVQYLTLEQAQQIIFPEASEFKPFELKLNDEDSKRILEQSGVRPNKGRLEIWQANKGTQLLGHFVLNEVIGKHEFITYAVGILPDGSVTAVEIMDYRENIGWQVKEITWRNQFTGKKINDYLEVGENINNISGATLSCKHVTEGVRRLLTIYELKIKNVSY